MPPSDAYVRSFLYLLYTLIKLSNRKKKKKLGWKRWQGSGLLSPLFSFYVNTSVFLLPKVHFELSFYGLVIDDEFKFTKSNNISESIFILLLHSY